MRAKRRLAALLALLLLAVPLAACQGDGDQASSPVLVVATPTPKADLSTLHIVMPENVETLHPLRATQREVRSLLGLVYESLLTYDGEGNPTGGLAASLEPDETAKVWTVKLRTQASWQGSGRPLSADDVIFTLDLIRQIGGDGAYASVLDYLENWEKVDETTVRISCKHGFMGNQMALDFPIVPMDAGFTADSAPNPGVGTGPYTMGELQEGENLTLTANPSWWKQQPSIKTVVAHRYPDTQTASTSVMLRQLDVVQTDDVVTDQYSYAGDVNTYEYVTPYFEFLAFNMASPNVSDIRLRQAVAYSLNRKEIASDVYMNHVTLADSPFFPGNALLKEEASLEQDAAQAQSLLAAMGWNSQIQLTLLTYDNKQDPLRLEAANLIARQLGEQGITVQVVAKSGDAFTQELEGGNFDLLLAGWYLGEVPDLSFALSSAGEGNVTGYASAAMDQKLAALLESGSSGFDGALAAVKDQLAEDMPLISLYFRNHTLLTAAQVKGVGRVEEDNAFLSIDQWIVGQSE